MRRISGRSRPPTRSSWRPPGGAAHTTRPRATHKSFAKSSRTWESGMPTSATREDLQGRLASFLWRQWAQMGILATAERSDRWAADPEALLLLSFEVGRQDPRLFEEVLDWLVRNERLVSIQR